MSTEMSLSRRRVVVTILISLAWFTSAPDSHGRQDAIGRFESSAILNNQDRAEIVKSVLEQVIADPVTTFIISRAEILSSENMTESLLPQISGYKFELLEPSKIEEIANSSGSIRYLVFSSMKARDEKVNVAVCRVIVITCWGRFSSNTCFSGEYSKASGSWTGVLKPTISFGPTTRKPVVTLGIPTKPNKLLYLTPR
jgi:hypothetical protein